MGREREVNGMRELKFRAFNKNEKKMCRVISSDFIETVTVRFPEFETNDFSDDYNDQMELSEFEPLMQYTGLKDKNGREIYEGDVVDVYGNKLIVHFGKHSYDSRESLVGGLNREVSGFYLESPCGSWELNIAVELEKLKVIGNIHENLELLGDTK